METENKSHVVHLQENLEKYNTEIMHRNEDLEFMKRSYDEQKSKVNKEHDMLSSTLYELSLQFITLKNELNKNYQVEN